MTPKEIRLSVLASRLLRDPGRDLCPGGEAEFGQDVLHVALRGAWRDHQAVGDGPVGQAFGDQVGDLAFPFGQFGDASPAGGSGVSGRCSRRA